MGGRQGEIIGREGEMRVLKLSGKGALVTAKGKTQATQAFESRVKRSIGNSKGNAKATLAPGICFPFL